MTEVRILSVTKNTMPELPEVETIRSDLSKTVVGKPIKAVAVTLRRLVKSDYDMFVQTLTGNAFTAINRRGKLLMLPLQRGGSTLLVHLKMTGQLIFLHNNGAVVAGGHSYAAMDFDLPNKYSYITFTFSDGSRLFFNDMRTFGYMKLASEDELAHILAQYGIEPLQPEFTVKNFRSALGTRTTSIKAALLNQNVIAGIGNIYADEICFAAGVRPDRAISTLTDEEIKKLYRASSAVIKRAIRERGTTFNHYRDAAGRQGNFLNFLKVFGRQGEACPRCKTGVIEKVRHAGRGTHFCPECQV